MIRGVKAGLYSLEAAKTGMVLTGRHKTGERLWISGRKDVWGLRLEMHPGVRIAGTVRDALDRPVEGASTEVVEVLRTDSVSRYVPAGRCVTDDAGRYAIDLLPSKSYIVLASPGRTVTGGFGPTDVATFYPDAARPAVARVVATEAAPGVVVCDIKLRRRMPGRVRVNVRMPSHDVGGISDAARPIIGLTLRGVVFDRNAAGRFPPISVGSNAFEFGV